MDKIISRESTSLDLLRGNRLAIFILGQPSLCYVFNFLGFNLFSIGVWDCIFLRCGFVGGVNGSVFALYALGSIRPCCIFACIVDLTVRLPSRDLVIRALLSILSGCIFGRVLGRLGGIVCWNRLGVLYCMSMKAQYERVIALTEGVSFESSTFTTELDAPSKPPEASPAVEPVESV